MGGVKNTQLVPILIFFTYINAESLSIISTLFSANSSKSRVPLNAYNAQWPREGEFYAHVKKYSKVVFLMVSVVLTLLYKYLCAFPYNIQLYSLSSCPLT